MESGPLEGRENGFKQGIAAPLKRKRLLILTRTTDCRSPGTAAAHGFGGELIPAREGVGGAREGEEAGGEAVGNRAGSAQVTVPPAARREVARDDDLEVGDMGPGARGSTDQRDEDGAEPP
jgi:hypothetical protein